jgi:hypothetical protein
LLAVSDEALKYGCHDYFQQYRIAINVFISTMEQHIIFAFSLIIEGTTEKVLQFIKSLMSIYNRNFGFIEQKCIFNSVDLLRAAPYMLFLVLHQDALFH